MTAALAAVIAEFCEFNHVGRFADGTLENHLVRIGRRSPHPRPPLGRRFVGRVLHVVTQAHGVGGHTRTLIHWMKSDAARRHSVVLTDQRTQPIPDAVRAGVAARGGTLTRLDSGHTLLRRADRLRQMARDYDAVFLHLFGHDVIPVLAFSQGGGPPIGWVNHGDHLFWLGGSVTDLLVNQRHLSRAVSLTRRQVPREVVLPIPLGESTSTAVDREEIRASHGVPPDHTLLLCVSRACKLRPTSAHNFYRTATTILNAHPTAWIGIVGASEQNARDLGQQPHPRLLLFGSQPSSDAYLTAADGYLEGFPFGSQTALLEAGMTGLPVVRAWSPPLPLLAADDEAINPFLPVPKTEAEYVRLAGRLIEDRPHARRLGADIGAAIRGCHTGDGWQQRLEAVYASLASVSHESRFLSQTECEGTTLDQNLADWHAEAGDWLAPGTDADWFHDLVLRAAHRLRQSGSHATAAHLLADALLSSRWQPRTAVALLKLIPHKLLSLISR